MRAIITFPLLLCFAASPVSAQSQSLSLPEAVERGLARAPGVAEARARERAASLSAEAGGTLKIPSLTASAGYLRTNHVDEYGFVQLDGIPQLVFQDIPANYRVRLEAAVPLYLGGRVEAVVAAAEAEERAATADRRALEADVRLAVTSAYWQAVTTAGALTVRERSLRRTDVWADEVRARVEVGLLPPNDSLSARAERARQFVAVIEARTAAAVAAAELAQLVAGDPGIEFVLATPIGTASAGAERLAALSPEALLAQARGHRGEREGLEARVAAMRATANGLAAATRPQVAAVAAVEPSRPNRRFVPPTDVWHTSWDLGVTVSWTFFDGGRARAEQAVAYARADAVGERVREFDDRLAVDVRRRQLEFASAQAAVGAAGEGVEAAAEARRVVAEQFAAGVVGNTTVLDVEVALLEAELNETRLAAALRLAEAWLIRTVGGA